MDKSYWWLKAQEASQQTGWFPTVILAQWQWETGNFKSSNFLVNNNIAGQTWQSYMPLSMRGTARPAAEGGYYIRYLDPVVGYVDFIRKNQRYKNVRLQATEEGQIQEIAAQGWAADPNYANGLIATLNANKQQGYALEEADEMLREEVEQLKDQVQTLLNTAEAHIEEINKLKERSSMPVPVWAQKAVESAYNTILEDGSRLLENPDGSSYDFYRLMTILRRKGLI